MAAARELDRRARLTIAVLATVAGFALFVLSWQRYTTFHNRTFDLAFYARIAWGLAVFDPHEPIVGAHVAGLHLSLVLLPLGWLGRVFGTVPVLLAAQATAYAAAAYPIARIGARRLGPVFGVAAALAWLLHPNLGHVVPYEFHPGTIAVLPLAWLVDAADRRDGRAFLWCVGATLACREDLATVTAAASLVAALSFRRDAATLGAAASPEQAMRVRQALGALVFSVAYLLMFLLVLHPMFAPPVGSLQLHFGQWGKSFPEVAMYLAQHPGALYAHLTEPARLRYVFTVLAPVGLVLPLCAPRWLVPALPVLAVNLVSHFPTTLDLQSHYLTPALPFVLVAAIEGAVRIAGLVPELHRSRVMAVALGVPVLIAHFIAGGTPLARDFPISAFVRDDFTRASERVVAHIPAGRSVQGPDSLLPHLAERKKLHRGPPPDRGTDFVVLDVRHRARFLHQESLVRTAEEPLVRDWLAKPGFGVVLATPQLLLLAAGADPRAGPASRYLVGTADPDIGTRLCRCLAVRSARLRGDSLILDLVAGEACPSDLVLRLGVGWRARRVDLLMDGVLSPARLRRGDRVRSAHVLEPGLRRLIEERGLRVGVLRQSGARPEPSDPMSVAVPLSP